MSVKLNINLNQLLASGEPITLDLGCGGSKKKGRIGIDRVDLEGVDIVGDIVDCLKQFPDKSVSQIYSSHFLEHVDDLELVIRETVRILKSDGTHHLSVPHFSNPYFYSDYTHQKFMGLYTFYYFVEHKNQLTRKVPNFYSKTRIKVLSQKLIFTSPFIGRWGFKKFLQLIFNTCTWMQEFYEENLCFILPCFALELVYTPDNQAELPSEIKTG